MTLDEHAERAQRAYDAAADTYDAPANAFWERHGTRTVERLGLRAGARVLDLPCGSGASALPAARTVGPDGVVVGVDVSTGLLALARAKAERAGLANLTLVAADMRSTGLPDAAFDAVVCVHGIFFVPEPAGLARELWRMVAPGGTLAVTTWGPGPFEPGASAFWAAVGEERPDLVRGFSPWEDLVEPAQVVALYEAAGIAGAGAELEQGELPVATTEAWWEIMLGTGYRATVEQLDDKTRERVRAATLEALRGARSVRVPAVYGSAVKPR